MASENPYQSELAELESLLHENTPVSLKTAMDMIRQLLQTAEKKEDAALKVAALTGKGHVERSEGHLTEAILSYDEALEMLPDSPTDAQQRLRRANLVTCKGIAQLTSGDPKAIQKSLASFDESIALRDTPDATEADRWGLAAAWLNRADALAILGGKDNLEQAVLDCEKSRGPIEDFELAQNPLIRSRLSLSWMKAGEFCARLSAEHGENRKNESIANFREAITVLREGVEEDSEESRRMLAAALNNLSRTRLLLWEAGSAEGEAEAREAMALLGDAAFLSPELLFLALSSRLNAAYHIAQSPAVKEGENTADTDRLLEVTDLMEDALGIAANGRKQLGKESVDENLLGELARVGAQSYLIASPNFLAEFLYDLLDPERGEDHFADSAVVHEAAVRTLWRGIAQVQNAGFADFASAEYEAARNRLVDWQTCREHLAEIRARYFAVEAAGMGKR